MIIYLIQHGINMEIINVERIGDSIIELTVKSRYDKEIACRAAQLCNTKELPDWLHIVNYDTVHISNAPELNLSLILTALSHWEGLMSKHVQLARRLYDWETGMRDKLKDELLTISISPRQTTVTLEADGGHARFYFEHDDNPFDSHGCLRSLRRNCYISSVRHQATVLLADMIQQYPQVRYFIYESPQGFNVRIETSAGGIKTVKFDTVSDMLSWAMDDAGKEFQELSERSRARSFDDIYQQLKERI